MKQSMFLAEILGRILTLPALTLSLVIVISAGHALAQESSSNSIHLPPASEPVSPAVTRPSSSEVDSAAAAAATGSTSAAESTVAAPVERAGDQSTSKSSLSNSLKNKTFAPDTEITDLRLRAEAGSLSRYSMKANLDYAGPTINDFSNPDQPNPDHLVGLHKTYAGGSIGTRYRFDSNQTMNFGTGVKAVTPTYGFDRVDVNNPYLSYDITKKLGKVQARFSPVVTMVTAPNSRDVGLVSTSGLSSGLVYNIGYSRWAASVDANYSYGFYNRMYRICCDKNASGEDFGIFPGLKYNLTDSLNLAGTVGVGYYSPRREQNLAVIQHKTISARLGIGWAVKRDIYIYPYLTMYPTQLEEESTSFNISTVFSVL